MYPDDSVSLVAKLLLIIVVARELSVTFPSHDLRLESEESGTNLIVYIPGLIDVLL